jgi:alpha-tubulin suppressor-like RCC1 family protein
MEEIEKFDNSGIIMLSCGSDHYICVCENGIFGWGNNGCGQIGIETTSHQSSPQQIFFFKNPKEIISISCGSYHCVCICKNGVFSWGSNSCGELGIGNQIHQSSPQQISFFKNVEEIISVYCGFDFCVCICKNGVFSWGNNNYGQLGIGNQIDQSSPQQISFFKNPEEIISLYCGATFSICICKNGVFSWGQNHYGQLGIGNNKDQWSPQQILFFKNPEEIISLCCGAEFCICICENGVFSWGNNIRGQLGLRDEKYAYYASTHIPIVFNSDSSSDSSSDSDNSDDSNDNSLNFPLKIEFFKNPEEIISLFCGEDFCICICKTGIFGWGSNYYGQLEDKDKISQFFPRPLSFQEDIKSFSNLTFPKNSIDPIWKKTLLLILSREYDDPEYSLFGKDYLPGDMFTVIMNCLDK